jgi:hypothetical protein
MQSLPSGGAAAARSGRSPRSRSRRCSLRTRRLAAVVAEGVGGVETRPMARPSEGNAKEAIRRRRRVTTAASSDDSVVAHSSGSLMYLRHPWCAPPLAQTFPQLAQHVVERGALTHSHDSERSSLCSQRGSLSALSSLRSARSHDFALLAPRTRAPLMGGQHHPKRGPAQPQLSGLAAHRPQSPYERRRAAASRSGASAASKDTKNTKKRGPPPPLPPPGQCQKFRMSWYQFRRGPPAPITSLDCINLPPQFLLTRALDGAADAARDSSDMLRDHRC